MNTHLLQSVVAASFVGIVVFGAAPVRAQGTSDLRGTVVDSQGGVLPGATITITNQDTGTYREVVSNPDAAWYVPSVAPGRYQLAAELQGFKRFLRRDILVTVGNTTTLAIELELGAIEETVTVTTEAPIIDVTSEANRRQHRQP